MMIALCYVFCILIDQFNVALNLQLIRYYAKQTINNSNIVPWHYLRCIWNLKIRCRQLVFWFKSAVIYLF